LVIGKKDVDILHRIADRERSPMYEVGDVTGDRRFTFVSPTSGERPMDLALSDMFGSSPKTVMNDSKVERRYEAISYSLEYFHDYLSEVLHVEGVACKECRNNKVDRRVGGRVAKQQFACSSQLALKNVGVMVLDYKGKEGIGTTIGHSPISALIDPCAGSKNSI